MTEKVELPRIAPSEYTTTSRLIHSGPCIVKSVHVSCAVAGGNCSVYDGVNTSGNFKAYMALTANTSYTWRPGDGTDFDYGLYISVNAATTRVTVTYIPESWKSFI